MTYDRDIFWVRISAWCLMAGNTGAGMWNLFAHNWAVAIACFIWVFSMLTTLWTVKVQQMGRDQSRVIQAGLDAVVRRETEQD